MRTLIAIIAWVWIGIVTVSVSAFGGCARADTTQLQTAISTVSAAIDPSYAATVDACIARQETVALMVELDRLAAEDAKRSIAAIRERCDRLVTAFAAVRGLLETARAAAQAGDEKSAKSAVAQAMARWNDLQPASAVAQ